MNKDKKGGLIKAAKDFWKTLDRSMYVDERLVANLNALTFVSVFTAALGLMLVIINITSGSPVKMAASALTLAGGLGCAYCAKIRKNRTAAVAIPTVFCAVVFTVYAFTGFAEGTGILWSILMPIGLCYFVSVRVGIILSAYYSILYMVIFYSPLRESMSPYYTEAFLDRFPIAYISLSVFTGMAMAQYHRMALLEIDYTDRLNEEVKRQTAVAEERSKKIEQMSFQTIQTLANAIDAKDPYTRGHSTRVAQYSAMIAQALGWDEERIDDLRYAAMLHDIGKIGVPDSILNNPKKLTEVEYGIIKSHTTMGGDILKNRIMVRMAEDVARSHHERYDGKGYPDGLKGEEIPEGARIVAIADAFDAMSSNRIYRRACDREHIMSELEQGKGRQFDPAFTDLFIELWNSGRIEHILAEENASDSESMEASSALLKDVMEAFVSQGASDNIDIATGIMNRTAGEAAIAQAMKSEGGCFTFFDVDNLKKINDTHGHEAGDRILKIMGDVMKENGENCVCCRLGGDEFLCFMKNSSRDEARERVEKIRAEFTLRKKDDPEVNVASLSAGMVMTDPEDTYLNAYNKADKALYHVKQNGKGEYCFYNDDDDEEAYEQINVNKLVNGIKNSGSYNGAMNVEYREFAKLYEFVTNLEKRFSHPFKLVMISLELGPGETIRSEELEKAMYYMEQSIRQTMRSVDVLTRYSRQQFLVILLGADDKGVKMAVDRIFRGYYKMNGSGAFSPSYSVADTQKAGE